MRMNDPRKTLKIPKYELQPSMFCPEASSACLSEFDRHEQSFDQRKLYQELL